LKATGYLPYTKGNSGFGTYLIELDVLERSKALRGKQFYI
jgi:hypothetical protein